MEIRLAKEEELKILTKLSKEAFDTDINVGGSEVGGPPNYDCKTKVGISCFYPIVFMFSYYILTAYLVIRNDQLSNDQKKY